MEVQVRLVDQEVVQVVLLAARLPLPGTAAEQRQPVVGRRAVLARVGPYVPVRLGIAAVLATLAEPGVLDRGVAQHLVDHHLQAQAMGLGQQAIKVVQAAEQRIDVAVVGDVIAEIGHRRLEERRDPDRVHAQRGEVVQALDDAWQVADPIAVGIECDIDSPPPGMRDPPEAGRNPVPASLAVASMAWRNLHTYSRRQPAGPGRRCRPSRFAPEFTGSAYNRR
ncbi:hypothetical protein G6F24_014436 [Rhizopus arrhizus]|nr:hypothetical protein G6F24_014436 [Rhizopus arrhizus]